MRNIFASILIIAGIFLSPLHAQELLFLFENNANDEMGLHNATAYGDIVYSTSAKMQGSYSCNVYQSGARFSTNNSVDLSTGGMTISFGLHTYNDTGGSKVVATNRATSTSDGWVIYFDRDNNRVIYEARNGSSSGAAYSATNSIPNTGTWYYITVAVMDVTGTYAKIFVNGAASGTDTTTVSGGAPANAAVHIGCFGDGGTTLFDRVDKFSIHKCRLSNALISTNYTDRTAATISECPGGTIFRPKITWFNYVYNPSAPTPPEDPPSGFTIYQEWDFDDQTLGQFTEAEIESYFSGATANIDVGREDLLNIVTETLNGNSSNKALQLTYPAETVSQLYFWDYPLNSGSGYSEVYVSMNIKYGDDDMTNWSSTTGGKNFGIKGYPWSWDGVVEPAYNEGFYVVPMFKEAGQFTHYYYNHWPTGQGGNYNYPSYGTNANYAIPGVWFNLTIRAKMNSTASNSDGILEIFLNGIPMYQYNNYRFYEDASLMSNLIDYIEFTHFFGGSTDEYKMEETAYTYWDDVVVWMPETPTSGLTSGTLDLPYPVTGETFPYTTLISTAQTFTNSQYGGNYSAQRTEAWLIDAGAGNTVTLTINAMDLDNSTFFQNDLVKIYDGNTPGSTLIGRHGSAISTNFPTVGNSCTSTGRYMYVIFESDRNGQVGTGFQMTVTFN